MRLYCSASGQYEAVESHKINSKVLNICVALLALTTTLPAVTASETSQSLAATGKVAIYGILFDSGKAGVKAECKALLDEIDKLLKGDAKLMLQLVGHTDNKGGWSRTSTCRSVGRAKNRRVKNRRVELVLF